jgi:hypothetical protein
MVAAALCAWVATSACNRHRSSGRSGGGTFLHMSQNTKHDTQKASGGWARLASRGGDIGIAITRSYELVLPGGMHLGRSEEKLVAPAGPVVHRECDRSG